MGRPVIMGDLMELQTLTPIHLHGPLHALQAVIRQMEVRKLIRVLRPYKIILQPVTSNTVQCFSTLQQHYYGTICHAIKSLGVLFAK